MRAKVIIFCSQIKKNSLTYWSMLIVKYQCVTKQQVRVPYVKSFYLSQGFPLLHFEINSCFSSLRMLELPPDMV